jgi:DNA-binding NarL/FixJ family response regulator
MPGLTGLDLVGRLQQLDPSVNALFISSLDTAHGLSGAALLKQFGVLPKPFEPEMLLAAVKSALARGPAPSPRLPAVSEEAWHS